MTEILLTVIIILLIINIVIALTKNNRLQTERLEGLLREEMKENRDELGRNIRELRNELNQTLNYSIRNMQDTLHKNLLTGNEMQREKFEAMGKQQEALVKSTEKRLDDMRQMVEEKLQKTLNERIGQSFEIVRSQLENVSAVLPYFFVFVMTNPFISSGNLQPGSCSHIITPVSFIFSVRAGRERCIRLFSYGGSSRAMSNFSPVVLKNAELGILTISH